MKILAISDVESKYLWDYFQPEKLEGVDLILSCGDLKASYLTLLATFTHAPLLYVHGNHDTDYQRRPPEGCTCIEDTVYEVNGVRIAGLGGSVRYKPGPFQYTQREMERRVARLSSKIRRMGGVDIIVAHAPVRGCNDGEDPAHMGFDCFNAMLGQFQPKYFVHGHVHLNYGRIPTLCAVWGNTGDQCLRAVYVRAGNARGSAGASAAAVRFSFGAQAVLEKQIKARARLPNAQAQ